MNILDDLSQAVDTARKLEARLEEIKRRAEPTAQHGYRKRRDLDEVCRHLRGMGAEGGSGAAVILHELPRFASSPSAVRDKILPVVFNCYYEPIEPGDDDELRRAWHLARQRWNILETERRSHERTEGELATERKRREELREELSEAWTKARENDKERQRFQGEAAAVRYQLAEVRAQLHELQREYNITDNARKHLVGVVNASITALGRSCASGELPQEVADLRRRMDRAGAMLTVEQP